MKIIHLSDLHFGTEDPVALNALQKEISNENFDLMVITGDFTQRAFNGQYRLAKQFIAQFDPKKLMIVPGNHDVSLHNLIERFLFPFKRYQRFLSLNLNPVFQNEEIALLGINSVAPFRVKDGYVKAEQLDLIRRHFQTVPSSLIRIVMMHHNLIHSDKHRIILNSEELFHVLNESLIDIVLSGHLHFPMIEKIEKDYIKHPLYIVTAGTSISWRVRNHGNSFNILNFEKNSFSKIVKKFDGQNFIEISCNTYPLQDR